MEGLFLFASLAILFASSAMGMTMFIKPHWVANLIAPNRRRHLSKTIKEVGFILTFISLSAAVLILS